MKNFINSWKTICSNCWDGIAVTDGSGLIKWANTAFTTITGHKYSHRFPAFCHPDDEDLAQSNSLMHLVASKREWEGEMLIQTIDASFRPVLARKQAIDPTAPGQEEFIWILRDLDQVRTLQKKLVTKENYHPLTRLPNRTFLKNRLQHCVEQARPNNSNIGLLHIDLDQFKRINTSLGHNGGDTLLVHVIQRLQEITRKADTVVHMDSDGFAVILEELPYSREASSVANRIINELSKPFLIEDKDIYISASIGISIYPRDAVSWEEMIQHAEEAMHAQKCVPDSSFQYYDMQRDGASLALLKFESDLRKALKRREFSLAFQPQVALQDMSVRGVEVLARWECATRGTVAPRQFIPVAEKTGLISKLGWWVLRTACRTARSWQTDLGLSVPMIAVNVSSIQFVEAGFLDQVQRALDESCLSPACLELEITESVIIQEKIKAMQTMHALRNMGIRIALDDFGTGHSSLAILRELPVDTLKIDKKFLRNVPDCAQSVTIFKAILELSRALDLLVVAEGVETAAQAAFLRHNKCPIIQGYWHSPPQCESDFLQDYRSSKPQSGQLL